MRVFLINPPSSDGVEMVREGRCMQRRSAWGAVWPPISLASIAGLLETNGFECRIRDCIVEKVDLNGLIKDAVAFNPELMIVNTATGSIRFDLLAVDKLKTVLGSARIFVIGIHPTALPEECLKNSRGLDGVIRGEPEMVALRLAEAVQDKKDWKQVPGVSYREGLFFYHNGLMPIMELDSLRFPAWHLVKRELYRMPIIDKPFLMIGTSRGCPFDCEFCADWVYYGKKLRVKSPAKIVRELDWAKTKFGISDFLFWAESFTLNQNWAMLVCQAIIDSGLKIRFVVNSRPDQVNLELLRKLKHAGCWMVGYGFESGSERMLKLMNKKSGLEDNKNAIRWSKDAGLAITGHFILGFPGETKESVEETIRFALEERIDFAQFYCAVPFPGSRLYERAKKEGWIITDDFSKYEQNFCVISTPQLKAEELSRLRALAYQRFYRSPKKILGFLRLAMALGRVKNLKALAKEFKEWMGS